MIISKTQSCNKNNSVSFGWLAKTHSYITKSAITKVPELLPYRKFIQWGSVIPDIRLSQTSLIGSEAHFWDGKNFNCFDTVPQNAGDFFCDLMSKAFMFLTNGNKKLAMYKAGETLHFLQDMAVPLHTKRECQGILKIFKHLNYERIADQNHDLLDSLAFSRAEIKTEKLKNLFINMQKESSSMENPFLKSTDRQASIETALTNAFNVTCSFLKKFADISKASPSNRQKLIMDEIFFT